MTVFRIWSRGIQIKTNRTVSARMELIDTAKNKLFRGCKSASDVKKAYEAFWNVDSCSRVSVTVDDVYKSNQPSKGDCWGIKMVNLLD